MDHEFPPVLSVIIPYYNGRRTIERTVDSVMSISHPKEILIIDDASSDGSFGELEHLYSDNPVIRLMSKPNGGIADTRNFGLQNAVGRYVFFSDQDDTAVADVIDRAIDRAVNEDDDIVFWSTEMTYETGRPNRPCDTVTSDLTIEGSSIRDGLLRQILTQSSGEYGMRFAHLWMGLYRREFLVSSGISFKRFISIDDDLLFIMDAASCAERVAFIPQTGYLWLQNYASRSHTSQYTTDFLRKTTEHFDYYDTVMDRAGCSEETRTAVWGFTRQAVIADSLVNWSDMPHGDDRNSERTAISIRMEEYAGKGVWDEYHMNADTRRRRTYNLIRHHMYGAAFVYNSAVSRIRIIRHSLRLVYERLRG